jgi:DNA-binding MarR family transcriptional regulator
MSTGGFDLDTFLPYRLAVVASRVSAAFAEVYGPRHGLSTAEWRVMAHLANASGPVSVREVFARVAMDKSKVSRAASRLELAGLIAKEEDPRDRRLVALSLTERGRAVMADLVPLARAFEARLLARLGPEEGAALARALERLGLERLGPGEEAGATELEEEAGDARAAS